MHMNILAHEPEGDPPVDEEPPTLCDLWGTIEILEDQLERENG